MTFIIVVSGAFAGLYVWRLHVDYVMHVLHKKGQREKPTDWYWITLVIVGLLFWASHAVALGISRNLSHALIRVLLAVLDVLRQQLFGLSWFAAVAAIVVVTFVVRALQLGVAGESGRRRGVLKELRSEFSPVLKDSAKVAALLITVSLLLGVFTAVNDYVISASPVLGEFISSMIVCAAISAVVALLFVLVVSPFVVGGPLRAYIREHGAEEWVPFEPNVGELTYQDIGWPDIGGLEFVRPIKDPNGGEPKRKISWPRILKDVSAAHMKDAVWYALIFTFVPCVLFRWALFVPSYPLGSQAPFIAVLVNLHVTGFAVGGVLDWLEVQRLRTYRHRRNVFPFDWQVDKNIRFTRIKSLGILVPVTVASWMFFFWAVVQVLPE
jgi:hypothetical protein